MQCDIKKFILSQSVLGVRDIHFLLSRIVDIAKDNNVIAGGDTACGFGNTAMILADRHYIPKIFAAVAHMATVVRTLASIEAGAAGPDEDCGYEVPYLKAITGTPISVEGKTWACAHLSPVGNVAAAAADLWSNESVQNIKPLSGMAPVAYYEQPEYDVRLLNEAKRSGKHEILFEGSLKLAEKELIWIDMLQHDISEIPLVEDKFIEMMLPQVENQIIPSEYGL